MVHPDKNVKTVFIFHGIWGYPEENWFPWLKKELEKLGCEVFVPQFPTPEGQTLANWVKVFENYKKHLNENSILVGQSLGAVFILRLLEKLEHPVRAAFLVAGFLEYIGLEEVDPLIKTFLEPKFDWEQIKRNCQDFFVYSSDNDPYLSLEKGRELASKLDVPLQIVKGAGHFNEAAGYLKFPLLLEKIRELK